jgi:hypothetical protein
MGHFNKLRYMRQIEILKPENYILDNVSLLKFWKLADKRCLLETKVSSSRPPKSIESVLYETDNK